MTVPDSAVLAEWVRAGLTEIGEFVTLPEFRGVLDELEATAYEERPSFVQRVLLQPSELEARGVYTPEDMTIQRSSFGDNRPTLFCVSKMLPDQKRKVTITFDNDMISSEQAEEPMGSSA